MAKNPPHQKQRFASLCEATQEVDPITRGPYIHCRPLIGWKPFIRQIRSHNFLETDRTVMTVVSVYRRPSLLVLRHIAQDFPHRLRTSLVKVFLDISAFFMSRWTWRGIRRHQIRS
jgi:hypothetical protein